MDIAFEIKSHIGTIKKYSTGWSKEVNIVSWSGNDDKVDIRDWDDTHERMSRGITLSFDETIMLVKILERIEVQR